MRVSNVIGAGSAVQGWSRQPYVRPRIRPSNPATLPFPTQHMFRHSNERFISRFRTRGFKDRIQSPGVPNDEQNKSNGNGAGATGSSRQPPEDVLSLWRKADAVCFDVDCMFPSETVPVGIPYPKIPNPLLPATSTPPRTTFRSHAIIPSVNAVIEPATGNAASSGGTAKSTRARFQW